MGGSTCRRVRVTERFFDSNNFATPAFSAEVCALLSVILVSFVNSKHFLDNTNLRAAPVRQLSFPLSGEFYWKQKVRKIINVHNLRRNMALGLHGLLRCSWSQLACKIVRSWANPNPKRIVIIIIKTEPYITSLQFDYQLADDSWYTVRTMEIISTINFYKSFLCDTNSDLSITESGAVSPTSYATISFSSTLSVS